MKTINDKWVRLIGIPLLVFLNFFIYGWHQKPLTKESLTWIVINFVYFTVTWQLIRAIIFYFRAQYSQKWQRAKRWGYTFLAGSVATTLLSWLVGALRHWIAQGSLLGYQPATHTASVTLNGMSLNLSFYGFHLLKGAVNFSVFQALYETLFFARDSSLYQRQLKRVEQEKEELRAENLQSQLDALKQQVNPHFLFNSLNVLDSLIEDDPPQARKFLEELSTVYRYLLRSNDHHLTDLDSELDFIHSYFSLLKTRHGSGLNLSVTINRDYQRFQLPPLTLQLLVENAVKHNIVLPDQPLQIDILTLDGPQLQVRNNIQRKTVRVLSNGVGLDNILRKYEMLKQPAPTIQEEHGQFVVTLSLIATLA
ncbi:sensor histidine kinase [Spirosoma endbachense]|uniref:sensor histidine kinase n=1 Tax=Spirosoma endbachense TaxID=2666025 RepID=UPI001E471019|nr:histidine kinase [Spirosoma endbachense]